MSRLYDDYRFAELNDGGNMAIRNGDKVKTWGRIDGKEQEIQGTVLTISRKGPNAGQAYIFVQGRPLGVWIDKDQLSKVE